MEELRKASGLNDGGDKNGARNALLRAKGHFESAKGTSGSNLETQAKIKRALGILDGLSGGITNETKDLPKAEDFLPQLPEDIQYAITRILLNTIQGLNPVSGPGMVAGDLDEWLNQHGLTNPELIQQYIENKIRTQGTSQGASSLGPK